MPPPAITTSAVSTVRVSGVSGLFAGLWRNAQGMPSAAASHRTGERHGLCLVWADATEDIAHADPSAPQRAVHAGLQRPCAGEGQDHCRRCADPRSGGRGRARRQGHRARPGVRGGEGRRLRPARADHPHQRARYALGQGRPGCGGGGGARCDPAAQARYRRRHRARQRGAGRARRTRRGCGP